MTAPAPGRTADNARCGEPFVPTPEMIAAAWDAWSPRHKPHNKLGPGPAFREAIQAALAKMPAPLPHPRSDDGGQNREGA